uniref:Uncharacterized protein n=1 Tax=Chromera velia CCMP2878 TaxID=1169474 RepID=A0A0G4GTT3_9ALVE|eukprot:Cvel_5196.t1-p1 / transcript=Cvel_5196.t1 / gene=Cvel_5196 / organism=Chromera_velia_CCMP2878 / gene_product=hypothetical protein / transcript_product=hypothetical protein / location=Cvel_scaffold239:11949-17159(+) / protein_length=342 / sequence_SO=supercontig / SO=protein_coding / is_pseudo=false
MADSRNRDYDPSIRNRNDDPPIRNRNDDPPLRNRNDDGPIRNRNDDPTLRNRNDDPPIRNRNDDPPIRNRNDDPPIRNRNDDPPLRNRNDDGPIRNRNDDPPIRTLAFSEIEKEVADCQKRVQIPSKCGILWEMNQLCWIAKAKHWQRKFSPQTKGEILEEMTEAVEWCKKKKERAREEKESKEASVEAERGRAGSSGGLRLIARKDVEAPPDAQGREGSSRGLRLIARKDVEAPPDAQTDAAAGAKTADPKADSDSEQTWTFTPRYHVPPQSEQQGLAEQQVGLPPTDTPPTIMMYPPPGFLPTFYPSTGSFYPNTTGGATVDPFWRRSSRCDVVDQRSTS